MATRVQDDKALLLRLKHHDVEFVIIGELCGVFHGLSVVTQGLEICCSFSKDNLKRVESTVKDFRSVHRLTANKLPFELTDELGSRLNNLYLATDLGTLNCLSEVKGVGEYEQVLKLSVPCDLSYGDFRMLSIDALIAAKEAVGRDRDLAAVRMLRAIKAETEKKQK